MYRMGNEVMRNRQKAKRKKQQIKGGISKMNRNSAKRYLVALGFAAACFLCLSLPSLHAAMSPQEILGKADEARGNAEGVEWQIDIQSIEAGREQQRTIRVTARSFNSLAEFLAPPNVKGQKLLMLDRNMWFAKPGLLKQSLFLPDKNLWAGPPMAI